MISVDEIADFTVRCHRTLDSASARIKELEQENKVLREQLILMAPKEKDK